MRSSDPTVPAAAAPVATEPAAAACPDRRCLLVAAAAGATALLAGCSAYGQRDTPAPPAPASGAGAASGRAAASQAGSAAGAAGNALAALADIPVGGGKVFPDAKLVVTRPTANSVKAFSAVCTHAGCTVGEVSGGTINCPCHGSRFRIADGSVAGGPAPKPLPSVGVAVQGGSIVRT